MGGAKAVLMREANYDIEDQIDATVSGEEPQVSPSASSEEEIAVKRMLLKKQRTSPYTVINRNGSRYTPPIDIVRSKLGRAEILKQTSQNERTSPPAPKEVVGEEQVKHTR